MGDLNVRVVPFGTLIPDQTTTVSFNTPITYPMTPDGGVYYSGILANPFPFLPNSSINKPPFRQDSIPVTVQERPIHDLSQLPPEAQNFLAICAYRAGVSKVRQALSLAEIRAHPERFRGQTLEFSLYDIDGTICLGQRWVYWLLLDLIRFDPGVVKTLFDPKLAGAILKGAKELVVDDLILGKELDRDFSQKIIKLSLKNIGEKGLKESFERFTSQFGFINLSPFVVEQIIRDAEKGRIPILLSAGPVALAIPLAEGLGIHASNVRGTQFTFNPKTGEVTSVEHLHNEAKVTGTPNIQGVGGLLEEFRGEPYKSLEIRVVVRRGFTDSGSDKPMARLALREGGEVFATNSHSESFREWIRGGYRQDLLLTDPADARLGDATTYIVTEGPDGRHIEVYGSNKREETFHSSDVPLPSSGHVLEISKYASAAASAAAGFTMGTLPQWFRHFDVEHTLAATNSIFVGAMTTMAFNFFLPNRGYVSGKRDLFLHDIAPISFFTGAAILFGFIDRPGWIAWGLSVLISSGLARLVTGLTGKLSHGFGLSRLNRVMDTRSNSSTGIRRALQVWLYQGLTPLFGEGIHKFISFLSHFLK